MNIVADLHTHTLHSGHATGTIYDNAHEAVNKGLKLLGISEHATGIPDACSPFSFYYIQSAERTIEGVHMLYGAEMNILNDGTLSLEEKVIKLLDYGICGIHTLCYEDVGIDKNTDNVISCMKHPKVKIVSHPDDDHTPLDYDRLAKAAKDLGVALEVNNSSILKPYYRLNCFDNIAMMLKSCERYGTSIVIDSDAHSPFYVGEVGRAISFVQEAGFNEDLIINTDERKTLRFLGIDKDPDDYPIIPDVGI